MSVKPAKQRAAALLLFLMAIPGRCLAVSHLGGKMSWWELLWWEGATDYPTRWWHGLAPRLPYVVVVAVVTGVTVLFISRSVRHLISRWQQGVGDSGPRPANGPD